MLDGVSPVRHHSHSKCQAWRRHHVQGRCCYLSEPALREQITPITNRTEAFHGFADWLMFGGELIDHNDPDHQEKGVTFNELIANCVTYSNACDITDAANALATVSPYITHTIHRFADRTLNLTPPDQTPPPAWTWKPACCSVRRPPEPRPGDVR
ncbi:Tn3 family transposase [Actinoallomurus sp. NPDC052308]|uniref:Tn3 family transposase n=1 Tax=Actinoallomurus sp. NPDC052308 TaxID=3155530 RepID=UPI00343A3345